MVIYSKCEIQLQRDEKKYNAINPAEKGWATFFYNCWQNHLHLNQNLNLGLLNLNKLFMKLLIFLANI